MNVCPDIIITAQWDLPLSCKIKILNVVVNYLEPLYFHMLPSVSQNTILYMLGIKYLGTKGTDVATNSL